MTKIAVGLLALGLAACGGGGGTSPIPASTVAASATAVPTSVPTTIATTVPTTAPTTNPSGQPTTAPTTAPTTVPTNAPVNTFAGAPLSSTPTQSYARRPQASNITGLPVIVESSGMVAEWAGDNIIWVRSSATGQDVAEVAVSVTSASVLVNNPAPQPQNCVGIVSGWCAAHPLGWVWGTTSNNGKPVGKQMLTVAAADGTTGLMPDYIYDGWTVLCNGGVTYVNGAPIAQGTATTADWYADCNAQVMDFPHGAQFVGGPQADSFGRNEPFMTTVLSASVGTPVTSIPFASFRDGQVYAVKLGDGGTAKVFTGIAGIATYASTGMSLHDSPSGSGTYPF